MESGSVTAASAAATANTTAPTGAPPTSGSSSDHRRYCRVLFRYQPQNDDELKLEVDDLVEFLDEVEEGWWRGVLRERVGVFPSNFVTKPEPRAAERDDSKAAANAKAAAAEAAGKSAGQKGDSAAAALAAEAAKKAAKNSNAAPAYSVVDKHDKKSKKPHSSTAAAPASDDTAPKLPPKPVREQAKVMYSYKAQNEDELTLKEGEIVTIITKDFEDKGWWKGELNGQIGVFPDNFVELIKTTEDAVWSSPAPKPDRPEKSGSKASPSSNHSPKPDLPDKPLFGDYPDRPTSKVSPYSKGTSSASSTSIVGGDPLKRGTGLLIDDKGPPLLTGGSPKPLLPSQVKKTQRAQAAATGPTAGVVTAHVTTSNEPVTTGQSAAEKPAATNGFAEKSSNKSKIGRYVLPPLPTAISQSEVPAFESMAVSSDGSEPQKLRHITADRARPPQNRRLPSHVQVQGILKEAPEPDHETQSSPPPSWMKSGNNSPSVGGGPKSSKVVSSTPPSSRRPVTGPGKDDSSADDRSDGPLIKRAPSIPKSTATGGAVLNGNVNGNAIGDDVIKRCRDLENDVKSLREQMITRAQYDDLLNQVTSLKDTVEANRNHYSKLVRELMSEIDEEKKLRMTLQVEIDRLKKLTVTV